MSIFREKRGAMLAVADGRAIPLADVPDEAFASGMLGAGWATGQEVVLSDLTCSFT